MNPIQDLADRIAAGDVIPTADRCTLLVRDCAASFDWTAASGGLDSSPQDSFEAADLGRLITAIALIKARDMGLGDGRPHQALAALATKADLYDLSGRALEELMDRPLQVALEDLVLGPAEMTGTRLLGESVTGGMVTTASDLASLMQSLAEGNLISERSWSELTAAHDGPDGCRDLYGLGLNRYLIGTFEVIGFQGSSGEFAFWLPFDVALTGTVNGLRNDRRTLLEATVDVLC
jgi:hypothetical protein